MSLLVALVALIIGAFCGPASAQVSFSGPTNFDTTGLTGSGVSVLLNTTP